MKIILATLFISVGFLVVIAIAVESIEIYFDAKQMLTDED